MVTDISAFTMDGKTQKDRIRGSLVGGAIGDTLGYPVEFISSYSTIQSRSGEKGITRLKPSYSRKYGNKILEKAYISGNCNSTGAVTGNILGAAIGDDAIPRHYKEVLKLDDVILHVADNLYESRTSVYHMHSSLSGQKQQTL